jgi:predicted nucleic acid-binding protein
VGGYGGRGLGGDPGESWRRRTIKLTDSLIAATAIEHGLAVVTQDEDYDQMARMHAPLRVLSV